MPPQNRFQRLIGGAWYFTILEEDFRLCILVIPAETGIQEELSPAADPGLRSGVHRDDGRGPFGKNFRKII